MKAVILVGGQATRLRPLTTNTPKAMVPVLNTPFLEHVIRHLGRHGVDHVVLAQHHLAQPIEDYFGDGARFGVRLTYVVEDGPRGTAGAIKNVEAHLGERCFVLNGDIFTDLDFTAMLEFHRARGSVATIALTPVEDPTAYGLIEIGGQGRVTRFLEKPRWSEVTTNLINAGTYILEPDVVAGIPAGKQVSIERETFPNLVDGGRPVYGYPSSGYWMDMGTPEKYLQLHRDLLEGRSSWYAPSAQGGVVIGEGCRIDPAAQIAGPAVIGKGCIIDAGASLTGPVVLGEGCTVAADCRIADSILWRNVSVGRGAVVTGSMIANDCSLGEGCTLEGAVLGDHVTVSPGARLEPDSRVRPGETV